MISYFFSIKLPNCYGIFVHIFWVQTDIPFLSVATPGASHPLRVAVTVVIGVDRTTEAMRQEIQQGDENGTAVSCVQN